MKFLIISILSILIIVGCKNKKKDNDNSNYFPILAYLQGQVKDIDTSLYSIVKIETVNGVTDSTPVNREAIRGLAADFLQLPDMRSEAGKIYTELSYDDPTMGMKSWTYTADEISETPRLQVYVIPSLDRDETVKTIYVEKEIAKGDSIITKRLIWEAIDHYFQIRTISSKKGGPEQVRNLKVTWNDFQSN